MTFGNYVAATAFIISCQFDEPEVFFLRLVPKKFTIALIKPDVVENGQVDEIVAKVRRFTKEKRNLTKNYIDNLNIYAVMLRVAAVLHISICAIRRAYSLEIKLTLNINLNRMYMNKIRRGT